MERFFLEGYGDWEVLVPATVYPPKEDTELLCKEVCRLARHGGKAVEIGCGSGIVSILLASLGWEVTSIDVNPYAVSATRGNLESHGFPSDRVIESGIGDGFEIPEGTDLLVWNIPYLDRGNDGVGLIDSIEEAALSDIPNGGWGGALLELISENPSSIKQELMVLLVMRTDPDSASRISDWESRGWSCRSLNSTRMGREKIEVFGIWRTGFGLGATMIESCASTMDEAKKFSGSGWHRVCSSEQTDGRGRRESEWASMEGGLFATWALERKVLQKIAPGVLQTSIGSIVANELGANMKWPNDIISHDGRKMGGVLVEASDGNPIRVGVGVNRHGFDESGVTCSGWEETLGPIDSREVFTRIDRSVSSFFEETGILPGTPQNTLVSMSWEALSALLSRGTMLEVNGELMRPVGLNRSGELETIGPGGHGVVAELDGTEWLLR